MGWNSWDFYGTSVNEERIKAQTDYQAAVLLPHGWSLMTVDIQWYEPNATGFYYDETATLEMDAWGRLVPAPSRFPSAAEGAGFKPLADYVHGKGLKFGIHMMRGIPRQAWEQDLPVKGTSYTARDVADPTSICSWNPDMYGVDMTRPGAQAYYDSVMELAASWGVDFLKIDDLSRPYHQQEIEAIRKAIDHTGRPMVLSTSPGETPVSSGPHIEMHANQWRISDDFWDNWSALYDQFQRLHDWTPYRGPGHFPDADMLPLGKVEGGSPSASGRTTHFTTQEQYTLMSLWAIARSPLIHGGDMTQMDAFTLALLTNDEVIAVNQASTHNRQLFRDVDQVAWVADVEDSADKYLAVFNTGAATTTVSVDLARLGFTGAVEVSSLWDGTTDELASGVLAAEVEAHGAKLFRLSGAGLPTPWVESIEAGDREVTVEWEALEGALGYQVKRATLEAGPYVTVAEGVLETQFTDREVENGTTYYYAISAALAAGETPDSGALKATPVGVAGIVGWNYDRYGTVSGGRTAGVVPAANWNNSWPDNPTTDLIDQNGTVTTLDISYSSFNGWTTQYPQANPGMDADGHYNRELLNGYLNAGPASWSPAIVRSVVTLSEIPHGYYDLIVYFSSDAADREGSVSDGHQTFYFRTLGPASVAGENAILTETTQETSDDYPAANYAIFRGLSGTSQSVSVAMRDDDEWGGIAAIQVVPQADPLGTSTLEILSVADGVAVLTWSSTLGEVVVEQSADLSEWTPLDPQPEGPPVEIATPEATHFFRLSRP
nr:glycoside hydrolase family 27 protein [Haloferula luteola]